MANSKIKQNFKVIKNNLFMLKYMFKYTPMLVASELSSSAASAVIDILVGTILVKYIIDSVQFGRSFTEVLVFIGKIFAFGLAHCIFESWYDEKYSRKAKEILYEKMQSELINHAMKLDLACYDNPKFYNDFVWATSEADKRAIKILETISRMLYQVITFSTITVLASTWDIFAFWFILVSFLISFSIGFIRNRIKYNYNVEIKPKERKRDYINRVFYLPDYAKELRLTNFKDVLLKKLEENKDDLIDCTNRHIKKVWGLNIIGNAIGDTVIMDVLVIIYLAFKVVVAKTLTYGSFVALVNAVRRIKWALQDIVNILPQFAEHSLYIDNFKTFLDYKPCIVDDPAAAQVDNKPAELELKDVSFTYPGCEEPTLKNINIKLRPYEKIAFVGHNGAGKSTLIKLIMRLYDTTSGKITLNGKDIREFSLKSYRESFGSVFQDYQIFAANLAENVIMDEVKQEDNVKIVKALDSSGFSNNLSRFSDSIFTHLTREFHDDGVNLSGGESQKVAISRTFARDCSYAILDEPSSALDPISEYNLNQIMMHSASNKSVILISHRLSSTRNADRIYMLENGRVIEEGSHEELMRKNGKYAEMFNMQAKRYIDNLDVG